MHKLYKLHKKTHKYTKDTNCTKRHINTQKDIKSMRISDYEYRGKRFYLLVYKFQTFDPQILTNKIRNTLRNIPYTTSAPCCGLSDDYLITCVREDDVKEGWMEKIPVEMIYGEQSGDDDEEYWDCFPKARHCSICKQSGHNKRTCQK